MRTAPSPVGTPKPQRRLHVRLPMVAADQARQVLGTVAWVALMLCAIGVVVTWRQQHGDQGRRIRQDRSRAALLGLRAGWPMYGGGKIPNGPFSFWFHRMGWTQQEPRYIANLATRAGDYVISVRQVSGGTRGPNLLFSTKPPAQQGPPLPETLVSLQVMAVRPGALHGLSDVATGLTATDDTGQVLKPTGPEQTFSFAGGKGKLIHLSAPAAGARYLRSLDGKIVFTGPQGDAPDAAPTTRAFHIANVPLPVMNHVFGLAAARVLDASVPVAPTLDTPGRTPQVLTGRRAEALKDLFPPHTPEPGLLHQPTRLILQPDVENRFAVPLPTQPQEAKAARTEVVCTLTPHVGEDGEIGLRLSVASDPSAAPATLEIRAWDNAPLVLILPPGYPALPGGADRYPLALWLHLYLDMPPPTSMANSNPSTPYPAKPGERGGELIGQVRIGGEPMALGAVQMGIVSLDNLGQPQGQPARLLLALDEQGEWRFANIAPGRYRVELYEAQPAISKAVTANPLPVYLRHRYGIAFTGWRNAVQPNVIVRAGGQTTLQPWQVP